MKVMCIVTFVADVINSVDWEDFKMSGSFINSYNLTFTLWKYKEKTKDNEHSAEKCRVT